MINDIEHIVIKFFIISFYMLYLQKTVQIRKIKNGLGKTSTL